MMTRAQQIRIGTLAAVLAVSSLRCGSDNLGPPNAKAIQAVSGMGQSAAPGQTLLAPLVVAVTDASGGAVAGVTVSWAAQGGGTVSSATSKTGSDGRASVQRTLGSTPGQQTTTASVTGLEGSPVTFLSIAGGGPGVTVITQPPPSALDQEVFDPTKQPVVSVGDDSGKPLAGVDVTASLTSGATLQGASTVKTDASGIASFGDLGIHGVGSTSIKFTSGSASATTNSITISALPTTADTGSWGGLVNWDIVPLHMSLMPNGKIIAWGKTDVPPDTMGMPRIWDPASSPLSARGAPEIMVDTMLFCAGFALMPDGRLLVSGGHLQDDRGIPATRFFTRDGAVSDGPDMAHGRWYPTVTVLPDGRALTMAGRDQANLVVTTPEIWEGGRWDTLPGAGTLEIPYYPRNFIDPKSGLVFYASERIDSRWFDVDGSSPTGRGRWIPGPPHIYRFNRDYGSAVMYEAGKILVVGGGGNTSWPTPDPKTASPTKTAEIIDLNSASPTWQPTGSMANPRRHMNATVLPDGQVLATGGTRGGGFVDINTGDAVKAAELWNPKTGQWTTLSSASKMRVYHSVSMLLPDGTVLHGSSGDAMAGTVPVPPERNHEIFSPPYLFKGVRPRITSAPTAVSHGETFEVTTPNKAQVKDVRWIRLGAVTHAFDAGQLANTLNFTPTANGVNITAPANPNISPGYYLLFILNRNGVPSEGKIIKFQ